MHCEPSSYGDLPMSISSVDAKAQDTTDSRLDRIWSYPLMEAITQRRSRRFAHGATLNGGGLAYQSRLDPLPLSTIEEALLVLAAAGITGYCLGELPYASGEQPESGGGNVMVTLTGRTGASAD